ncbi:MAG: PTS sugar transporter subunit IIA [Lentisphaerae bacterium]|nr:PTS sugar transporter subunit IIA [Lentisphaerota bacterium]
MTTASEVAPTENANAANVHPLLNSLVQLQELVLVRSEQDAAMSDKHLPQLDVSIQSLLDSMPVDVRFLFQKIQKKDLLAIVPISNNVCSGCGLTLPVSLVYAVRAAEKLHQCTNCARILYYPEARPRRVPKKTGGRFEPRRPGIARFSSPTLMVPNLKSTERDKCIAELARLMAVEGFVDDSEKLVREALKREAIINTSVDRGLAFPHVRGVEGGGLTLALGLSRKGIRWNPAERVLTHIVFFIVIPTAASVFYLRLLSGIVQTFARKNERDKLLASQTATELWAALVKATRNNIK